MTLNTLAASVDFALAIFWFAMAILYSRNRLISLATLYGALAAMFTVAGTLYLLR